MGSNVVPSLTDRGWLKSPAEKADSIMSYFFETDAAQTYLYQGSVQNIQNLLSDDGMDIPTITSALRDALETLLQAYFDSAQVQVTNNNDPSVNPTNSITLQISATVTDGGEQFSLVSLIQTVNSRFQRVINYTNTGVLSPS